MRDSDTYQAILDEGREQEVKRLIRLVGEQRFGLADESILAQINGIADLDRLERMLLRLYQVSKWRVILDTP